MFLNPARRLSERQRQLLQGVELRRGLIKIQGIYWLSLDRMKYVNHFHCLFASWNLTHSSSTLNFYLASTSESLESGSLRRSPRLNLMTLVLSRTLRHLHLPLQSLLHLQLQHRFKKSWPRRFCCLATWIFCCCCTRWFCNRILAR